MVTIALWRRGRRRGLGRGARAGAAECRLELKRIGTVEDGQLARSGLPVDYLYRNVSPQHFFMQLLEKPTIERDGRLAEFSKLVKKEPKYNMSFPLRAVANLGGKPCPFAIDAKEAKSKGYGRLYFDFNRNGDLTDDKPVEAESEESRDKFFSASFPRIHLTLDVDGTKIDYAFFFSAYGQTAGTLKYATASLMSAAYREGRIMLDGRERHLVLLDYNSNGRFDDSMQASGDADGRMYPQTGDVLWIDPEAKTEIVHRLYDINSNNQHQVSKLMSIDGKFYNLRVSPAGDTLSLSPSTVAVGYVTSRSDGFRGTLYGDQGVVKIACGKSAKAALPEGRWRLLSYTIDQTKYPDPAGKPDAKKKPDGEKKEPSGERSWLGSLIQNLFGGNDDGPRASRIPYTLVSGNAAKECVPINVRKDATVELPFGPPYKTTVTTYQGRDAKQAQIQLSLIGAGGEACSEPDGRGTAAQGAQAHDQEPERRGRRAGHLEIWLRLHLRVLVASTIRAGRGVSRSRQDERRSVQDRRLDGDRDQEGASSNSRPSRQSSKGPFHGVAEYWRSLRIGREPFELGKDHLREVGTGFGLEMEAANVGPVAHGLLAEAVGETCGGNGHLLPFVGGGDFDLHGVVVAAGKNDRLRLGAEELET